MHGCSEDLLYTNPVAGLEERESPEKYVDVEEEEEVGEQNGVVVAPSPERRERGCRSHGGAVAEEGEIEENGRERSEKRQQRAPHVLSERVVIGGRRHDDDDTHCLLL